MESKIEDIIKQKGCQIISATGYELRDAGSKVQTVIPNLSSDLGHLSFEFFCPPLYAYYTMH